MIEQIIVLFILLVLTHMAWKNGQTMQLDRFLASMRMKPNAYRLWDRLLFYFHRRPFSLVTLQCMAWGTMMSLTYVLLDITGIDLLLFLLGAAACSSDFKIRQSLMYPLLVLFVQTQCAPLLVLIVAVKEVGLWIALGYLILTGGDVTSYVWVGVAGVLYLALRHYITGQRRDSLSAPLFTPPYYVRRLRQGNKDLFAMIFWDLVGSIGMLSVVMVRGLAGGLLLWAAVPIILFALWWEPQLWFPVLVVLLAGG